MNLNSCVCATVERHTKILRQNNNFCLKGIVCSTHCWRLISQTLDCACDFVSVVLMVFQSRGSCLCDSGFLGRQRTQVGNRLGLWFIEISFASHCAAAFLWASACSHTSCSLSRLLFCVSDNNDAWFTEWKTQTSSPLRTNLLFPHIELLCIGVLGFFLGLSLLQAQVKQIPSQIPVFQL